MGTFFEINGNWLDLYSYITDRQVRLGAIEENLVFILMSVHSKHVISLQLKVLSYFLLVCSGALTHSVKALDISLKIDTELALQVGRRTKRA